MGISVMGDVIARKKEEVLVVLDGAALRLRMRPRHQKDELQLGFRNHRCEFQRRREKLRMPVEVQKN